MKLYDGKMKTPVEPKITPPGPPEHTPRTCAWLSLVPPQVQVPVLQCRPASSLKSLSLQSAEAILFSCSKSADSQLQGRLVFMQRCRIQAQRSHAPHCNVRIDTTETIEVLARNT